jgi:hypothetical protein
MLRNDPRGDQLVENEPGGRWQRPIRLMLGKKVAQRPAEDFNF